MTDTKPRREYVAAVASVGKDKKGVGWALALAPRQGMQYPDTIYGKPETEAMVKDLKPGQRYTFVLERDNLRKNKPGDSTNPFDYFETLLEVRPAPAEAQTRTDAPHSISTQGTRASEFRTPEQMIRGVALEQATALAVALVAKTGERLRTVDMLLIASKYTEYITTGDIPKIPEPPLSPKAQADRDFEDFFPGETLSGKPPASLSPSGGASIPPPDSAQAPTAAAGTLLPAARQPGRFVATARDGKPLEYPAEGHAASPAASAPAGAVLGGGAPETSGGHPGEPETKISYKRPPDSVKNYTELLRVCNIDFHLQPKQVFAELNVPNQAQLTEPAASCYRRIAAVHTGPPQEQAK